MDQVLFSVFEINDVYSIVASYYWILIDKCNYRSIYR